MAECSCGSGETRYELKDARGIFCTFVCDDCVDERKAHYDPRIFENAQYDAPDLGDDLEAFDPDWEGIDAKTFGDVV